MLGSGRGYSALAHRASYMRCLASVGHWAANTVLSRQHEYHSDYIYGKHQTEPNNRQIVSDRSHLLSPSVCGQLFPLSVVSPYLAMNYRPMDPARDDRGFAALIPDPIASPDGAQGVHHTDGRDTPARIGIASATAHFASAWFQIGRNNVASNQELTVAISNSL